METATNPKTGKIGTKAAAAAAISYNLADGLDIVCQAHKTTENCWEIECHVRGELRATATVFGGKGVTNVICRHLRNALTSRLMHKRKVNENRRARKAAAAPAEPGRVLPDAAPSASTPAANAAAMREALVRVRGWLERMNKERLDAFAESQITPAYAVNKQAKTIIEDNEYHIGQIDAALSEPGRVLPDAAPSASTSAPAPATEGGAL